MNPAPTGLTDLHNHLVPGVDDGARSMEDSLEGLGRLRDTGVKRVATTPHLVGSLTRDSPALELRLQEVEEAWKALRTEAAAALPELELERGYEVMLDVPDADLSDPRLHLGGTSYVLVEWPGLRVPPGTSRVLNRLVESGVRPVVAHPERYRGMDREWTLPGEWRESGAVLQVNYGSLAGRYGDEARERALAFLERGWVDLLASDFHGRPHLHLFVAAAREVLEELEGGEQFDTMARVNTARVLRDEPTLDVQPVAVKQGVWEKVRSLLPGGGNG